MSKLTEEELQEMKENVTHFCFVSQMYFWGLVAHIAAQEAERRWIPVGEQTPPHQGIVITLAKDNSVDACYVTIDEYYPQGDYMKPLESRAIFWGAKDDYLVKGVTHWMPLPSAPIAEGEEKSE